MRRHNNIGYDAFNSYRSGDENTSRNSYGSSLGNERGGSSVYGRSSRDTDSAERNFSTEPGYGFGNRQGSGANNPQGNYDQNQDQNRYRNSRPEDSSYTGYNQGRGSDNSWQDRASNWMENAEGRIEQWGSKINNAWENWQGDDNNQVRRNWMDRPEHYPTNSHGNAMGNRYSDNYDNANYGRQQNVGNYGNRGNQGGRHEEEGFFDHLGQRISNVWDRWVGNDEDEERRYQNRSHYGNSGQDQRNDRNSGNFRRDSDREDRW